jgi:hypothetical protein
VTRAWTTANRRNSRWTRLVGGLAAMDQMSAPVAGDNTPAQAV